MDEKHFGGQANAETAIDFVGELDGQEGVHAELKQVYGGVGEVVFVAAEDLGKLFLEEGDQDGMALGGVGGVEVCEEVFAIGGWGGDRFGLGGDRLKADAVERRDDVAIVGEQVDVGQDRAVVVVGRGANFGAA